ncbi:MAG TPA: YihA family ribosome biogenesis GTP-binding protein [Candidatus Cloacimonetes bacterium]|nr:YihA family ribosome biogenesis GTP-binding protein [Candidatus Cloacimonadota bacterium]
MKINNARYVESALHFKDLTRSDAPEIAFMGRSNVGKSSLINGLVDRKNLAQISKKPGKTRTINIFELSIQINGSNQKINFADLPGYGFAKTSTKMKHDWKRLIEEYVKKRHNLIGLILLIDIRHDADYKDIDAKNWIMAYEKPCLLVATKADKLNKSKVNLQKGRFVDQFLLIPEQIIVAFSAKSKIGKKEILAWIAQQVLLKNGDTVC